MMSLSELSVKIDSSLYQKKLIIVSEHLFEIIAECEKVKTEDEQKYLKTCSIDFDIEKFVDEVLRILPECVVASE
ncbi:MAG: hypothetical protein PHN69_03865 [Candidatus Pacebacteria bacterium]|nr:hypothetical protein [Candidatus Paceibacterota bacterium]